MSSGPPLGIGLALPAVAPWDDLVRGVGLARELDLDAVTIADHLAEFTIPGDPPVSSLDATTVLGVLAASAGPLRIGVGVTDVLRRHPVVVGQAFLTLAAIAAARPILGVGAGERLNSEPYGVDVPDPVARLEEALPLLRACLHGDELVGDGPRFTVRAPGMDLAVPKERIPSLWIGAHGPRMLELAGRFGDGWYPADVCDPVDYAERLAIVLAAAVAAGRQPGEITAAAELVVVAADDDDAAYARLGDPDVRVAGLLLPASAWTRAGLQDPLGDRARGFVDYVPAGVDPAILDRVPVDLVARHVLWGGPQRIAGAVAALADAGMRHVNLGFGAVGEDPDQRRLIASVVSSIRDVTSSLPVGSIA